MRLPMIGDETLKNHRMRYSTAYPMGREFGGKSTRAYRHIHFAVMAIENAAKRMKIPSWEVYRRLKAQNLIHNRLLSQYDALHTQGIDWVAEDTVETLLNWEAAEQSCSRQKSCDGVLP